MNIEQTLIDLKSAIEANTAALNAVLTKSGGTTPAPAPTEAPAKAAPANKSKKVVITPIDKTSSLVTAVDVEETVVTTPEPDATPEPAAPVNRDEALLEITTIVKGWMQGLGAKLPDGIKVYTELRKKWGIEKATDLKDEQLVTFIEDIKVLIATEL